MRFIYIAIVCSAALAADKLPVSGLSHVGFRVADLEKTRAFYTGVLGFEQAFDQKNPAGVTTLAVFKINEDEFLEFNPGASQTDRFTHIAFLTAKLEAARQMVAALGLDPPELRTGRDRTRNFSIKDPDGHRVEFVEYEPDSMHAQARGKFAGARRISTTLKHAGIPAADRAKSSTFFRDNLGVGDFVELLPQNEDVHLCFEVPNLKAAMQTLHDRGLASEGKIHDPDGTWIELVESAR